MRYGKLLAALLCGAMLITGCGGKKNAPEATAEKHTCDVFAMDTYMTLTAYGDKAEDALGLASKEIYRLESLLSTTLEGSDISDVNLSGTAEVSEDTLTIIDTALRYSALTDGALDITVYPVLKEWGFTTGEYRIPSDNNISELLGNVDCTRVKTDGNTVTVGEGQQIDLGALAKGYTSDRITEMLRDNGVSSAIVSLGGNVQALGSKPDGSDWTVAVVDPFAPDTDMCTLKINNEAVITSGSYERYFTGEDGKNYFHIIDSADGCPAENGLVSVTVIGESGIMCDALSTALFVMGTEKAVDFYCTRQSDTDAPFELILVTDDGRILCTEGIADSFTNLSTMSAEVIGK